MKIPLVVNGTTGAGNGKPTTVTQGHAIRRDTAVLAEGFTDVTDEAEILVEAAVSASTVGSIAYIRIWCWYPEAYSANKWFPVGTGSDDNKGKLNGAAALGETDADIIRHAERLRGFREGMRIYAEYGALTNITRLDVTMVARG